MSGGFRRLGIRKLALGAAALAGVLALTIDDWRRDFTAYSAVVEFGAEDRTLRPLVAEEPVDDLVEALKAAAWRMGGWQFVGTAANDRDTWVSLVRSGRILRFVKDDVRIRIRDRGRNRALTGESRSRLHVGDLGRNPRNLRRLLAEVEQVLDAAK